MRGSWLLRLDQALERRVGAAVVDEDELEGDAFLDQRVGVQAHRIEERRDRGFFIVDRNDDCDGRHADLGGSDGIRRRPVGMQERRVHRLPEACRLMDGFTADNRDAQLS